MDDIKQLIINRNSIHRSARPTSTGSPNEWKAFREKKREAKLAIKNAEIANYNKKVTENKYHSSSIWITIRQALPRKAGYSVHYTNDTNETAAHSAANLASAHGLVTSEVTPVVFETSEDLFVFQPVASTEIKKVIIHADAFKQSARIRQSSNLSNQRLPFSHLAINHQSY